MIDLKCGDCLEIRKDMDITNKEGSKVIELYQGCCLDLMNNIKEKSVDMILCDLP